MKIQTKIPVFTLRHATESDVPLIISMIRELDEWLLFRLTGDGLKAMAGKWETGNR